MFFVNSYFKNRIGGEIQTTPKGTIYSIELWEENNDLIAFMLEVRAFVRHYEKYRLIHSKKIFFTNQNLHNLFEVAQKQKEAIQDNKIRIKEIIYRDRILDFRKFPEEFLNLFYEICLLINMDKISFYKSPNFMMLREMVVEFETKSMEPKTTVELITEIGSSVEKLKYLVNKEDT